MHDTQTNKEYDLNEKKQKLIVLGAGPFQMHLIEKAQEMGAYVIAVTPHGTYPGIKVADKIYFHDAKIEEYIYEVAKLENVDGVISDQGEIFVRAVAYAAEKMGLPGNGYETALLYTDKYRMRERSKALGLATIEHKRVDTVEEAREFFEKIGTNAIIKPVDASSSRGVYKIASLDDLYARFDEAKETSLSGQVIIEQFIDGPQFEVDSIAAGGTVKPLMYADLDEYDIPDVFSSRTRLYPSVAPDDFVKRLLDYSQKINEGFGMYQGLSHNEYIMDEKTGEIYLIEAALRGGGTFIASYIAWLETGIDTAEFLVNIALGRSDKVPDFEMNRCHAGYVTFYLPVGEVLNKDGCDEVEALDYVVKTTFDNISLHSHTKDITDKNQRHAVVLYADSREQILERIETIRSMIKIKVQTDEGIKGPIWE